MPGRDDRARTIASRARRVRDLARAPARVPLAARAGRAAASRRRAWASVGAIASARMWPAQEYTRVIARGAGADRAPDARAEGSASRRARARRRRAHAGARRSCRRACRRPIRTSRRSASARARPTALRIVFDLKPRRRTAALRAEAGRRVRPSVVLDLYPLTPLDPLMALLEERREPPTRRRGGAATPPAGTRRTRRPDARTRGEAAEPQAGGRRAITIAIDPGHGGEDPGAIGRRGTYEKNVTLAIGRKLKTMHRRRARHARDADARRRLLRAARRARAEGAPRRGRPLRLDPRRRVPRAAGARLVGVRAVRDAARRAPRRDGSRRRRTRPT